MFGLSYKVLVNVMSFAELASQGLLNRPYRGFTLVFAFRFPLADSGHAEG